MHPFDFQGIGVELGKAQGSGGTLPSLVPSPGSCLPLEES